MLTDAVLQWRGDFTLTRDLEMPGDRMEFYRRVRQGEFIQVFRGVYVRNDLWRVLGRDDRYRLKLVAASAIEPGVVFAGQSAAAQWRLPVIGEWPGRAQVVHPSSSARNSTSIFHRRLTGVPEDLVQLDGLTTTGLARTVVDVAAWTSFGNGVTVADAALRRTAHPVDGVPRTLLVRADLEEELESIDLRHGSARARRVVEFADGASDRPGESMSRVSMNIARITAPVLQVELFGASGKKYIVDFWWPVFNVIGEFDGDAKYRDPEFLRGRTPEEAFIEERRREDDLRAAGHGMTRWHWAVALSPKKLKAHLAVAGVR